MSTIMKNLILILFLILMSACSSSKFYNLNDIKKELNIVQFPEQKDYENDDAVIIKEEHDVDIKIDSDWELETLETTHIIKKLLKNIENNSTVEIYLDGEDKLNSISARTIKSDGSEIILDSKDFHTSTGQSDNTVFYADDQIIKFTFPAIENNCLVEFKYSILKKFPFVNDRWRIQKFDPIIKNTYKLTAPVLLLAPPPNGSGWKFTYQNYNCLVETPNFEKNRNYTKSEKNESVSFEWERRDVPAFKTEPNMPPISNYIQYVKFSRADWKSWNEVSKWFYNLFFLPQLKITETVSKKAKELTADSKNDLEKLQSIYSYIQKLRYISIKLGQGGGLRPNFPETIIQKQYGDCKDKSILMISLLKSIGIKASPVLVLTSDEGINDTSFPNLNFNHMIVKASLNNGTSYFLDGTAGFCKIGELPAGCEGCNVLVINDGGMSNIEHTPASSYNDNEKEIIIKANISNSFMAEYNISIIYKGEYDIIYRNLFKEKTSEELAKFCKSLVVDDFMNAEIMDYKVSPLDMLSSPLVLSFKVKTNNVLNKQGDLAFINIDPFKFSVDFGWLSKTERKYDIEYSYPFKIKKTIEVVLPNNLKLRNLPENINLHGPHSGYDKSFASPAADVLVQKETISIISKTIPPEGYAQYRNMFENLQTKSKEKLVFTLK